MWDYYEFTVSNHFLPAFINDDLDDLDDQDRRDFIKFENAAYARLPKGCHVYHWAMADDLEDNNFQRCEITNMQCNTEIIRLMFRYA